MWDMIYEYIWHILEALVGVACIFGLVALIASGVFLFCFRWADMKRISDEEDDDEQVDERKQHDSHS